MGYRSKNAIIVKSAPLAAAINPTPGVATGTGAALQPSVTIPGSGTSAKPLVVQPREVHPWWRTATGALITTAPLAVAAMSVGIATGAGAASQPAVRTGAAAGAASGAGAANQPTTKISPVAGRATGAGAAHQAGATTPGHVSVAAGNAAGIGTAYAATGVLLLSGFTHVTVIRDYDLADGAAPTGTVYFTPSTWLFNNGVTVPPAEVAAPLDVDGKISVALAANDDPGTVPGDSHYVVREEIVGQPVRSYEVTILHTATGDNDLGSFEPPPEPPETPPDYGYGIGYGIDYGGG